MVCWYEGAHEDRPTLSSALLLPGVIGLVLGTVARRRATSGRRRGKGLALSAVIASVVAMFLSIGGLAADPRSPSEAAAVALGADTDGLTSDVEHLRTYMDAVKSWNVISKDLLGGYSAASHGGRLDDAVRWMNEAPPKVRALKRADARIEMVVSAFPDGGLRAGLAPLLRSFRKQTQLSGQLVAAVRTGANSRELAVRSRLVAEQQRAHHYFDSLEDDFNGALSGR